MLHLVQSTTSGTQKLLARQARKRAEGREDEVRRAAFGHACGCSLLFQISLEDVAAIYTAAGRCCTAIAGFLTQRSSKAAKNASANEAEYKAVLEHLVRDSLVLVDFPQWPAATLMIQTLTKILVRESLHANATSLTSRL